jgi:hypothetical protein
MRPRGLGKRGGGTHRIPLVLCGMQNRTFGSCLVTMLLSARPMAAMARGAPKGAFAQRPRRGTASTASRFGPARLGERSSASVFGHLLDTGLLERLRAENEALTTELVDKKVELAQTHDTLTRLNHELVRVCEATNYRPVGPGKPGARAAAAPAGGGEEPRPGLAGAGRRWFSGLAARAAEARARAAS